MYTLEQGDCLELLKHLDTNSIDAVICDPPAGISFMGKEWDNHKGGKYQWIEWLASIMAECKRVLKPGGHALIWALPRTSHWTANAIEDSGFEIRDRLTHIFGSGFPKNLDISKAIDKKLKANRKIVGMSKHGHSTKLNGNTFSDDNYQWQRFYNLTAPATPQALEWQGWGTALKPSVEDWWLARKPLERGLTVADNVLKWGTGGLNLGACRVATNDDLNGGGYSGGVPKTMFDGLNRLQPNDYKQPEGRFPPNLILSHSLFCTDNGCHESCPIAEMDRQSGISTSSGGQSNNQFRKSNKIYGNGKNNIVKTDPGLGDTGGASRFYPQFRYSQSELDEIITLFHYFPKASQADRNTGLEDLPLKTKVFNGQSNKSSEDIHPVEERFTTLTRNIHPTVKNRDLCRWLVRLVTPKGGMVLDPFMGSGSIIAAAILEGCNGIGFELEEEYFRIAQLRVKWANSENGLFAITGTEE